MENEKTTAYVVLSVPFEDGVDISDPIVAVTLKEEDAKKIVIALAIRDESLDDEAHNDLMDGVDIGINGYMVGIKKVEILTTKEEIDEVLEKIREEWGEPSDDCDEEEDADYVDDWGVHY